MAVTFTLGAILGVLSAFAFAEELGGAGAPSSVSGELEATWASPNHLVIDFDGTPQAVTTGQDAFVFDLQAIPGDAVFRTLTISNTGTADGALDLLVLDATMGQPGGAVNQVLADESNIVWRFQGGSAGQVPFAAAMNQVELITMPDTTQHSSHLLDTVALPAGSSVDLDLGWALPINATSGNRDGAASVTLSFDVLLKLYDIQVTPTPSPTLSPTTPSLPGTDQPEEEERLSERTPSPTVPTTPGPTGGAGLSDPPSQSHLPAESTAVSGTTLPFTGSGSIGLAVGSIAFLAMGFIILAWRRRRDEEQANGQTAPRRS